MPRTTYVSPVLDNVSDLFVSSADVLSILSLSVMFVYFVPFWFSFRALSLVDATNSTHGVQIIAISAGKFYIMFMTYRCSAKIECNPPNITYIVTHCRPYHYEFLF